MVTTVTNQIKERSLKKWVVHWLIGMALSLWRSVLKLILISKRCLYSTMSVCLYYCMTSSKYVNVFLLLQAMHTLVASILRKVSVTINVEWCNSAMR